VDKIEDSIQFGQYTAVFDIILSQANDDSLETDYLDINGVASQF